MTTAYDDEVLTPIEKLAARQLREYLADMMRGRAWPIPPASYVGQKRRPVGRHRLDVDDDVRDGTAG